jgi:hypothetical protein
MIIVQLLGGLGNQMFQYAFGQRLAFEYSQPVYYDTRLLRDHSSGRHARNYEFCLDVFSTEVNEAPVSQAIRYSADGLPRIVRGACKLCGITNPNRRTTEVAFGYDESRIGISPPAYFAGLWQSFKYFTPIASQIRNKMSFRHELPKPSLDLQEALSSDNSVCLHVRRTDYLTQNQNSPLGFVGLDYYRTAVQKLRSEFEGLQFYVFSDDLKWCESELDFLGTATTTFVDNTHAGYKDSGHLHLMSLARHFVVPNSTFSWWAAWLCSRQNKQVFLPRNWFRDSSIDTSGYYFDGTIAVG